MYCKTHMCTSPQCTQPKTSKAKFCDQHSANTTHYVSAEESRRQQGGSVLYEQQATGSDGGHVQPITFVTTRGAHGTMASSSHYFLHRSPYLSNMASKQNLDLRCVFGPSNLGAGLGRNHVSNPE